MTETSQSTPSAGLARAEPGRSQSFSRDRRAILPALHDTPVGGHDVRRFQSSCEELGVRLRIGSPCDTAETVNA